MKKFLALVLAVLMIASTVVSVSAFNDVAEDYAYADAINALQETGVIQGKTATEFAPDENVTRLQMALFMARATTAVVDDAEWAEGDDGLFTDCTQYLGAIQYCFTEGIIKGVSATEFAPNANITLRDGVIMAVRALGYEKEDEGKDVYNKKYNVTGANYWLPYYQTAKEIGLLTNLDKLAVTKALTRGETAQLIANMLDTKLYVGGDDYGHDYTLADVVFGGKQVVNVENITAAYISETPLQSMGADTIGDDEEIVLITVLDENRGNPEVEVPFADLEDAGIDVENIEEYFGAYIELVNCRIDRSNKDEDGYYIYKDYEYLSGADKTNSVTLTNADIQYHKNNDRIRIESKTHYFDEDSKARNYIAIYTAEWGTDNGWVLVDSEDANAALKGKYYDIELIDYDLDGYYEIGLVSFYNLAEYSAAKANGKATCGVMEALGVKNVEYSEELSSGDFFVYTYNPFTNYVDVKEVIEVAEGKITAYSSEEDKDHLVTAVITIDGVEYEVEYYDVADGFAAEAVTSCFQEVHDVNDFIAEETSIVNNGTNLRTMYKDDLATAAYTNVGATVEYYLCNGELLTIGRFVPDAAKNYLVVKEWTDFELGEYAVLTAYIDGVEESIKVNKVTTLNTTTADPTDYNKVVKIADIGYNKLSKLFDDIFGMYSYTVDEDGFYSIKEFEAGISYAALFNDVGTGNAKALRFSSWQTRTSDLKAYDPATEKASTLEGSLRVNSSTLIYVVDEGNEDVTIVTPTSNFNIELGKATDYKFFTDRIGYGDPDEVNTYVNGLAGVEVKYGVSSFIYIITNGEYASLDRADYKLVFVESALASVAVGSAEDFDLELGEDDKTYFEYPASNNQAYVLSTFASVDGMFVDKDYRAANFGNAPIPCGVYLLNADNIVVDHVARDNFGPALNGGTTITLKDKNVDFAFHIVDLNPANINLYGNKAITFSGTGTEMDNFNNTTNIQTVTLRFYEYDSVNYYKEDKSNDAIAKYVADNAADFDTPAALKVIVAPNAYTGFDASVTFTGNTLRGIVYDRNVAGKDQIVNIPLVVAPNAPTTGNNNSTTYTVKFNANGGQYTPASVTQTKGLAVSIPMNLARDGMTFMGWNTKQDGTGTAYSYNYDGNVDVVLYAQWQ